MRRFLLSVAVCALATAGVAGPLAYRAFEARDGEATVMDLDDAPARLAFVDD